MPVTERPAAIAFLTACLLLSAIAWAYWPGLAGGFIFDDYANLEVVGAFGDPWRWPHFAYYLSSGSADPTGRPVALLTFLLDGDTWPTDPWPFKRTNLALHVINTALLSVVISRLQADRPALLAATRVRMFAPLLAAGLWGAHPFFVSTTLYVVQREAMLPMSFMLCAILAWRAGMQRFAASAPVAGWLWCIVGFGCATMLAGLSKANGFLAPLLVGICQLYFLRPRHGRRHADAAALALLVVPSLIVLAYLCSVAFQFWGPDAVPGRAWSLQERLLSQPRALWDYVFRLAVPRSGAGGVFVEGFVTSRDWYSPATTLPAAIALGASVGAAWAFRNRAPVASFSWIFFLGAHLLESTTVPLELYFEHRNYVPAMFLGWPIANACLMPGLQHRARIALAFVLVLALLALTHQRAVVWGDPKLLSAIAASHEADSARAQVGAAQVELERGEIAQALSRMRELVRAHRDSVDVTINAIGMECQAKGELSAETLDAAQHAMRTAHRWNYGIVLWVEGAAGDASIRACRGFGESGLLSLIEQGESNPHNWSATRLRDLKHMRGLVALEGGDATEALRRFDEALSIAPEARYALVQAAALGNRGYTTQALTHLDHFARIEPVSGEERIRDMPALHRWLLRHYRFYEDEVAALRRQLQADVAAGAAAVPAPKGAR